MIYRSTNNTVTYTADSDCYVVIWGNHDNTTSMDEAVFNLCGQMLNLGSTPLPYEPYGYKIPISLTGQTIPIYLGEVKSTRQIKKIEVKIERVITLGNGNKGGVTKSFGEKTAKSGSGLCDKAPYGGSSVVGGFYVNQVNAVFVSSPTDTLDDFKSKYDGASLWYILATEETGIVNEPLMRIGDYADTLSMEQAGVDVPTNKKPTETVVDVPTSVKPSEGYIKYTEPTDGPAPKTQVLGTKDHEIYMTSNDEVYVLRR